MNPYLMFISEIENFYGSRFKRTGGKGGGGIVRPVCAFVMWKFSGCTADHIRSFLNYNSTEGVFRALRVIQDHYEVKDGFFMRHYDRILQFWILACTRYYNHEKQFSEPIPPKQMNKRKRVFFLHKKAT